MPKRKIEIEVTGKETASQILAKVDKALAKTGKASGGLSKAFDDLKRGAMERIGQKATNLASQIPAMAVELFKLGAQSEAVTQRFTAFAGSAGLAQEYLAAFQTATDGTVAKMDAMAGASKMLQMGLVNNADEMGVMAAVATKLGNQTMAAGDRIADFSALLANRSIPRLDNFGISSGKVRAKVEKLKKAGHDLDQAFKLAVLEEGRKSLEKLGDTSDLTATKLDKLSAAWKEGKVGVGEWLVGLEKGSGALDYITGSLAIAGDTMHRWAALAGAVGDAIKWNFGKPASQAVKDFGRDFSYSLRSSAIELAGLNKVIQQDEMTAFTYTTSAAVKALRQEQVGIKKVSYLADGATTTFRNFGKSQDETMRAVLQASKAMEKEKLALERVRKAAIQSKEAMFDMSMSVFDQQKEMVESAEEFASDKEKAEAKHIAKMAELQKKGQAKSIKFNEAAESKKLATLKWKLNQALLQQSEFSDKTKQSTLNAKERQIAELVSQVGTQKQLMADYYAGRLTAKGANVSAEIAAEQARYATELEMLNASQTAQEEAQRASLGRMLLTQFDAWAQMHGVSAEKAMEMRVAIATEYGLMDEKAAATVNAQIASWGRWAAGSKKSATEIVKETDRIIAALGRIPRKVNISFTTTGGDRLGGPAIAAQHGYSGWVGPGHGGARLFLAGEGSRAEHVSVTPGGRGGGGGDITVIVEGSVMDDRTIERIVRSIDRVSRLRGTGRGG